MRSFKKFLSDSEKYSREATLSIWGVRNQELRKAIESTMMGPYGSSESLLSEPVFEQTFGWEPSDKPIEDLTPLLLSDDLVRALDTADDERFERTQTPYRHQLSAWETLKNDEPKSVVVTTGTGSGKTECFMVPILDDLYREASQQSSPLIGVRALFLYPLNALINSQEARLTAWTKATGNKIRYSLFTGAMEHTEHSVKNIQKDRPNQVLSRELLRKEPTPIMMTNSTMLEYMLIRQIDKPIIEKTKEQNSLSWIVLDEAHTYIGSQAAELSLLLRRVINAFGADPAQIRFVATSATIAGPSAEQQLQHFLADLAGIDPSSVTVISGTRVWQKFTFEPTNNESFESISAIDKDEQFSTARYEALSRNTLARTIRDEILASPKSINELINISSPYLTAGSVKDKQAEVLQWLDLMTDTADPSQAPTNAENGKLSIDRSPYFLKTRIHQFQRTQDGLFTCVNPHCDQKSKESTEWPYGKVYTTRHDKCGCGGLVTEFAFCKDCNHPTLLMNTRPNFEGISARPRVAIDDFKLDSDNEEDFEDEQQEDQLNTSIVVTHQSDLDEKYSPLEVNPLSGDLIQEGGLKIFFDYDTPESRPSCSECGHRPKGTFYRQGFLGSPFYMGVAVPNLLNSAYDPPRGKAAKEAPEELPFRGRRLVTFTDSRQGTARLSVKLQQDGERARTRGQAFKYLIQRAASYDLQPSTQATAMEQAAAALEAAGLIEDANALRSQISSTPAAKMSWNEMIEALTQHVDINRWILEQNKYQNPLLFHEASPQTVANLLLAREFSRRPKNANSLETLGLIQIGYQNLNKEKIKPPPGWSGHPCNAEPWHDNGKRVLTHEDWIDFLTMCMDFWVRENTATRLNPVQQKWMGARFSAKQFLSPNSESEPTSTEIKWPSASANPKGRVVKQLAIGIGLDINNAADRAKMDDWLKQAYASLREAFILENQNNLFALTLPKLEFSLPENLYLCPVTNRLFSSTFLGLTPYIPATPKAGKNYYCDKLPSIPELKELSSCYAADDPDASVEKWILSDKAVAWMRERSLWSDTSDRVVHGGYYVQSAEHSAQQSADRLRTYEYCFNNGWLNVLNCSTTMEMGVDLKGLTSVLLSNVPPHPANYLQRSGRAGRGKENRCGIYTICKNRTHDQRIFLNPKWAFVSQIAAPKVTLSSEVIVQRHLNSFMLSQFLNELPPQDKDTSNLRAGWFFGKETEDSLSMSERFESWLTNVQIDSPIRQAIKNITKGSILEGISASQAATNAQQVMSDIRHAWVATNDSINAQIRLTKGAKEEQKAYQRALEQESKRHTDEFLLKELTVRGYLPGYGFPTHLVTINTASFEEFKHNKNPTKRKHREDNIFDYKAAPTRSLDVAVREYAPGAELVVDGRVYKSAGISLNAMGIAGLDGPQKFDTVWKCRSCGAGDVFRYAYASKLGSCTQCGSQDLATNQMLVPLGFTTDFFAEPKNDIENQFFVKGEKPLVTIEGALQALPNPECGFLKIGSEGGVIYQSLGQYGTGYAICMRCGKSESMTQENELPQPFRSEIHRPLSALTRASGNIECDTSAVMSSINLGYKAQTDVVELHLKNPSTGRYIPEIGDGKIVALTLGAAIRDSMTSHLGISQDELGYARRPAKSSTGETLSVIQIYDKINGGAGFCTTAIQDLGAVLKAAAERLVCPANCNSVCQFCLGGNGLDLEADQLDRHLALNWLTESSFLEHLKPDQKFETYPDAQFVMTTLLYDLFERISRAKDEQVSRVNLLITGDQADWELSNPHVRTTISKLILSSIPVTIFLPETDIEASSQKELIPLIMMGTKFKFSKIETQGTVIPISQLVTNDEVITYLSLDSSVATPNDKWLGESSSSPLLFTRLRKLLEGQEYSPNLDQLIGAKDKLVYIPVDFRSTLSSFGLSFIDLVTAHSPDFRSFVATTAKLEVEYQDRYLRSPAVIMMLANIFSELRNRVSSATFKIETVFGARDSLKPHSKHERLFDNFISAQSAEAVIHGYCSQATEAPTTVYVDTDNSRVPHQRLLTLKNESGKQIQIILDQGMGCWMLRGETREDMTINLDSSPDQISQQMFARVNRMEVRMHREDVSYLVVSVD
jgi:DEAD/DEAH box helicase domain-containing protein